MAVVALAVTLSPSGHPGPVPYAEGLVDRVDVGDVQPWPDSVRGAMPGVGYRDPYGGPTPVDVADAVVVGRFTAQVLLVGFFDQRELADVADELVAVDRVALFLNRPVFTERSGWAVSLDWSLLGEVSADGAVTWPVLDAARAAEEERRDGQALPPQRRGRTPGSLPVDVFTLEDLRSGAG
ncbi:hypothetical protein [Isoptericola sediminis]|uniref:Uncharacterized protein n=1 Tax=Isoptericola sediminis TaxID=2733572 RepID=A0A849JSB4_9MICO|nr:hypothetical protein [Isoptericola sediminis]NNU26316.1 hypothetical protein [Isoptericola sediminis]